MQRTGTIMLLALVVASLSPLRAQDILQPLIPKEGWRIGCCLEGSNMDFTDVNGTVFFYAFEQEYGDDDALWVTNGFQEETYQIGRCRGCGSFTNVNGTLFLTWSRIAPDEVSLSKYPWGNIKTFYDAYIGSLVNADGTVFFAILPETGATAAQLWKSNGTEAGTVAVHSFDQGELEQLTALGTLLFFETTRYEYGTSGWTKVAGTLWISDGTETATVPLLDNHGREITFPTQLTPVGMTLFFAADDPDQPGLRALWKSDGTPSGTSAVRGGFPAEANFDAFAAVGNTLFFAANDGTHGQELWRSDGTSAGTMLLKDLRAGPEGSEPVELTAVGTTLFFGADDPAGSGRALWKSSGTAGGTVVVKRGFSAEADFREFTDLLGTLYFLADDGVHGQELWKSNGTAQGTGMVADLRPGPESAFAHEDAWRQRGELTVSQDKLFFSAYATQSGAWVLTPAPSQVAHWPIDDATGNIVTNTSGNDLDGTLRGEPTWTPGYPVFAAHSLTLDGTDDYVSVEPDPALDLTTGLTLMGWFKHSATGGDNATGIEKRHAYRLLVKEDDQAASTWMFDLWTAAGTFYRLESAAPVYNDQWHHMAATYDGQEMKLYVDGALVGSRLASGAVRTTALPLEIGRRDGSKYYAGSIDEVRLFGGALSAEEVKFATGGLLDQACFTAEPKTGPAPLTVAFDASCTFKPYIYPGYSWTTYGLVGSCEGWDTPVLTCSFSAPGSYEVDLSLDFTPPIRTIGTESKTIVVTEGAYPADRIAHWPFEDSGVDIAGNDLHAGLFDASFTDGRIGRALALNGSSTYATVSDAAALDLTTGLTLAAWVNHSATGGDNATGIEKRRAYRLLAKEDNQAASTWMFDFWDEAGTFHRLSSTARVPNGNWHHVAVTYDGAVMRLYVDGVLSNSQVAPGSIRVTDTPLEIGRRDGLKYYAGSLDEVQLYSRALSQAEVRGLVAGEALAKQATAVEATPLAVAELAQEAVPETYELDGNYPNPFNPQTEIRFGLPEASMVTLVVYDVQGRAVARLMDGPMEAGYHAVRWQASAMPSGVYLYRLTAGAFTASKTMVLLK